MHFGSLEEPQALEALNSVLVSVFSHMQEERSVPILQELSFQDEDVEVLYNFAIHSAFSAACT